MKYLWHISAQPLTFSEYPREWWPSVGLTHNWGYGRKDGGDGSLSRGHSQRGHSHSVTIKIANWLPPLLGPSRSQYHHLMMGQTKKWRANTVLGKEQQYARGRLVGEYRSRRLESISNSPTHWEGNPPTTLQDGLFNSTAGPFSHRYTMYLHNTAVLPRFVSQAGKSDFHVSPGLPGQRWSSCVLSRSLRFYCWADFQAICIAAIGQCVHCTATIRQCVLCIAAIGQCVQ